MTPDHSAVRPKVAEVAAGKPKSVTIYQLAAESLTNAENFICKLVLADIAREGDFATVGEMCVRVAALRAKYAPKPPVSVKVSAVNAEVDARMVGEAA